jgi:hypothetical protein
VAEHGATVIGAPPGTGTPDLALLAPCWLRLDGDGRILTLSPGLATGDAGLQFAVGQAFASALMPASQLLWAVQQWPSLKQFGSLQETLLDLATAGHATGSAWPVISTWCVESASEPKTFIGMLTPGHERQRLLADLKRARSSLDAIPGALLQIELQPDHALRFPYASSTLLELLGVTPSQAAANSQQLLKAFTPESSCSLSAALHEATASAATNWKTVLTLQRTPRRHLELPGHRRQPA